MNERFLNKVDHSPAKKKEEEEERGHWHFAGGALERPFVCVERILLELT